MVAYYDMQKKYIELRFIVAYLYVMPRKPAFIHPLRKVREATRRTQKEFANLVGRSTPTIQSIENGKLALSDELAQLIFIATGADPTELKKGRRGRAIGWKNRAPYTSATYEEWIAVHFKSSDDDAIGLAAQIKDWIEVLLLAASKKGGRKLWTVYYSLIMWLQNAPEDFEVRPLIDIVLRQWTVTRKVAAIVADLRDKDEIEEAKRWGFIDHKSLSPKETVTLQQSFYPVWAPATALRKESGVVEQDWESRYE